MLKAELLMQWYYLIFLLPLGVSAVLLLLSSVRMGHHSGVHGGHTAPGGNGISSGHASHGAVGGHSGAGHGPSGGGHAGSHASSHHATTHQAASHGHTGKGGGHRTTDSARHDLASPAGMLLRAMGVGRAPLPMVLEAFCM